MSAALQIPGTRVQPKRELTNLEMEALTLVHEEVLGPEVTKEERLNELLETKKNRKAGENLYDFLERQVKEQMGMAIGQPLQDVSETVLKKVGSKTINSSLRKYQATPVARPMKRNKIIDSSEAVGIDCGGLSKDVASCLRNINEAAGGQMSLVKTLIVKCDENHSGFSRLRSCFDDGDWQEAERLLTVLEESNHAVLTDLQCSDRSMIHTVGLLSEHLKTEAKEYSAALRAQGGNTQRGRADAETSPAPRNRSASTGVQAAAEQQIAELKRQLETEENSSQQLRDTMREMVDDYSRQLEMRDQQLQKLEAEVDPEVAMLAHREIEALKQENRMLRDKVGHLDHQLTQASSAPVPDSNYRALQDEVGRLSELLMEKDRQVEREMTDQKNEWAEIYNAQKAQNEQIQREIGLMAQENEKLMRKLESQASRGGLGGGKGSAAELAEATKRLKKRELECQALWETLKDLKTSVGISQMKTALAKRSLDTKAQRKLSIE